MTVLDDLEFIFFHLMPYVPLPDGYQQLDSLWVDYPNANFDPVTGHELYKRYWSELLLADKLGYDGVFVNEHHNTQFTMNAAPNLTEAAIIPHTSCRIGVYGTPPNFEYPIAVCADTISASPNHIILALLMFSLPFFSISCFSGLRASS